MKRYKIMMMTAAAALSVGMSACVKDLTVTPIDENITLPEDVLNSQDAYRNLLAKCYQGLCGGGSWGGNGDGDLSGIDANFGQYLRVLYNCQEITTDEAVLCWNDAGVHDLDFINLAPTNPFIEVMYARIFFQVNLCNEFIRQANDARIPDSEFPAKSEYIAEARALRALSYYHAVDLFGSVPFATENTTVGGEGPAQKSRKELFDFVVSECKALLEGDDLAEEGQNEYGRCDKGFVRMILAKMYLNAEVWAGENRYAECAEQCREIIAKYPLHTVAGNPENSPYSELFMGDNHLWSNNLTYNGDEIIFAVPQDYNNLNTYGGTTYIIFAAVGGNIDAAKLGISSGWSGLSLTRQFAEKFDLEADARAMFHTDYGLDIDNVASFAPAEGVAEGFGYKALKFTNANHDGTIPPEANRGFANTDFPLFRSADAYLMLAECNKRLDTGNEEGLKALNEVRDRAGLEDLSAYSLQDVLDERARELYWECTRRQDLVRYGQFTSADYVWAWKGAVKEGSAVDEKYNLFPIPAADLNANGKLTQNPGY